MTTIALALPESIKARAPHGRQSLRGLGSARTAVIAALAMLAFGVSQVVAQTITSFSAAGPATWICPAGVTTVQVEAYGGGGGGGGVYGAFVEAGGGAGGSYVKYTMSVTPGTTYQMTVGSGGTGGSATAGSATSGTAGTSSYFGNSVAGDSSDAVVLAVGGQGAPSNNTSGADSSHYNASTLGAAATTSGDKPTSGATVTYGSAGANPVGGTTKGGGNGGNAGNTTTTGGISTGSKGVGTFGNQPGGGGSGADQGATPATSYNGGAGGVGQIVLTYTAATPTISSTGTPTAVSTGQGTASLPTSFSAAGVNLTANITVNAPTGFELSVSSDSGYAASLTLIQSGGTVAATTIYVRLTAADVAGTYSGNVNLSSSGATTVNAPIPASTVVSPATQGNLVVEQLAANATSSAFSIIELNPSTPGQASPVNSYIIPSTGVTALRQSSAGSTGRLATSDDGTLLAFTGFEDGTGVADETSITARGVGTLDINYSYSLPASYTSTTGTGDQTRSATRLNGTWYMGDKSGIYLNGTTTPANPINVRPLKSFGGAVYALSANATPLLSTVSADGTTLTGLNGLPGDASAVDFYMLASGNNGSAFDILYVLDGANVTKFSLVGTTWMANGHATAIGVAGDGICAAGNGTGASLYVTTGTGLTVNKVTDIAGYNTAPSINTANNVTVYTAVSGYLKGLAFAPVAAPLPDLTIATAAPAAADAGVNFNYTLTVANSGAGNAAGVTAQFTLPAGLTFVSAADNGSGGFTAPTSAPGGVVTFTGGALNAGASDTLTVTVNAANGGSYTAAVGSAVIDPNNSIAEANENNNSSTVAVATSVSIADLVVDVTAGSSSALAGSSFTYTLTARNIGTATASGIPLNFTLPSGITFMSATDNGSGGFTVPTSANGSVISFTGGTLAAGASDTFTVTVMAAAAGTFTVPAGAAVINPGQVVPEGNYANDASTSSFSTVVTAPDLSITCTHNGSFQPGDSADTYTIYVSNDGGASTSGSQITVTYTLPTGIAPAASMDGIVVNGWSMAVSGQTVTATRSDVLAPDSSYPPLAITVSVASNASGALSSTASVSGGGDVSTGNNSVTVTVNVGTATPFTMQNNLIVSRSVYSGTASTVPFPGTLANGAASVHDGTYPGVWANETPDSSFGITAAIYLDQVTKAGSIVNSFNLTDAVKTQLGLDASTSFPSKSEIALNLTPDGSALTFVCYLAPVNALDIANTDTPYHVESGNPLIGIGTRQRAIVQFDSYGNVQVTPTDAYTGDNGRAAVLAGGNYFTVGNAGNSSPNGAGLAVLSDDTGLQMLAPGAGGSSTPVGLTYGTAGNTTGYQHGFSIDTIPGFAADKSGKDLNLRGLTYNPFNSTLYVSKGSGGNGINTVYQVGGGGVPTVDNASSLVFTILPGFSQTSSGSGKDSSGNSQTVYYPFGMWFGDANTLYVADEGQVSTAPALVYDSGNNVYVNALPAHNPTAGLQKWKFDGTKWNLVYTVQAGLNLGQPYPVPNDASDNVYPTEINPATGLPWTPSNNGLRNIVGQANGDGTVTIFAVTSTASGATDQGADPNQLVSITDSLAATILSPSESFATLRTATYGEVLRGVALSPGPSAIIQASASPTAGGAISGSGSVAPGTPVTLVATPNANYSFVNWTENGTPISTSATYSFTAIQDRALIANFASANADLSSLSPSAGTLAPVFAAGTTSYADTVPYSTSALSVTPMVADSTATVTVNGSPVASGAASGSLALSVGANTITTVVTAQSGTTKTYTLVVTRQAPSSNADLAALDLGGVAVLPAFDPGTVNYTASVSGATASVTVSPTVSDGTATVTVNGSPLVAGSVTVPLVVGPNTITMLVTAQDGVTTKSYSLAVSRPASFVIGTSASPADGGTTSGGGSFDDGISVTVSATANPGYVFVNWTEGGSVVSTTASYTFTASGNRTLVANFDTSSPPVGDTPLLPPWGLLLLGVLLFASASRFISRSAAYPSR